MASPNTDPAVDYEAVEDVNRAPIEAFEKAVKLNPKVAAAVLRATGVVLAGSAWKEISFDRSTEEDAQQTINLQRISGAESERDRGRLQAANVVDRAAIWAEHLAATAHHTAA